MFSRIQNLHISQTQFKITIKTKKFSRIQNLYISQTTTIAKQSSMLFSRIQNLHISQTTEIPVSANECLVEFKIYISLKRTLWEGLKTGV